MTGVTLLVPALIFLGLSTPATAQTTGASRGCDLSSGDLPRLSPLSVQSGRLAPGESTCFNLLLQQGEFARISIDAEVGYLRGRIVGPRHDELQVTWTSSFSNAAPSLPLAIEAPENGLYILELSVPTWVPFTDDQSFRVQMLDRESATMRAARRQDLLQDERVTWLRTHAERLRSIQPDESDFSDLDFLREVLGDARLVLLGEGDNGGGSDVLAITRLIRFLHEQMGFDVIAFPAGVHSSTVAWRALRTETDPREAVLKAVFRLLAGSAQAEALIQYLSERARADTPLELTGFDSQFTGTAGGTLVAELKGFLAERSVRSPFTDSQAVPSRVLAGTVGGQFRSGSTLPSFDEQAQTVHALRETAVEIERRAPDRDGARWAQILRSTAVQVDLALNNARGATGSDYMSGLASQRAENLRWLVNQAYPDRKVIVWMHTLHVMRDPTVISLGRPSGRTVGQAMWEALGTESFSIGLTSYNGRSHWITAADDYYQDLIPGQHPSVDFETLMDAAGHELAFVNLRAARARGDWLGGRFVSRALHLVPQEAEWSSALDALLFIRTQEPRRRAK